jgi:pimeloyl-ACP methyl ester carboxylesterase
MVLAAAIFGLVAAMAAISAAVTAAVNRHFPPEGDFRAVEGGRLHLVDRAANGPSAANVLLIHGASASLSDQLTALSGVLSRRYRVVAVDRPGQGWSDRPGGARDACISRQAAMIVEAVRQAGIGRAIVIGHSLGAAVAGAIAVERPEFAQGIVFVAPATHPWPGGVAWHYRLTATPVLGRLFAALVAPIVGVFLLAPSVRSVFNPQSPPKDYVRRSGAWRALTPLRFEANGQDVAALHANVVKLSSRYRDIRAPCIIITGDQDGTVWPSIHSEGLACDIQGSKLVVLRGVGHMPHHVRPDAVLAAVDEIVAMTADAVEASRGSADLGKVEPTSGTAGCAEGEAPARVIPSDCRYRPSEG